MLPILKLPKPPQSQPAELLDDELLEDELLEDELEEELLPPELPLLLLSHWPQFSLPKNGPISMSVCTDGS